MEVDLRGNNSILQCFYIGKRPGHSCHMKTVATATVVAQGVSASTAQFVFVHVISRASADAGCCYCK